MTLYFFLLITVIRVFVPITCDAFVGLKIYSTRVNWFFSPVVVLVVQSCPALCNPMDCSPPGSSVPEFSRQEYWNGLPFPSPGVFPTQGSNLGLPHYRQILYHLSHQGSPKDKWKGPHTCKAHALPLICNPHPATRHYALGFFLPLFYHLIS